MKLAIITIWESRAVNKYNKYLFLALLLPGIVYGQAAGTKKKITLGDLMKKAQEESRGSKAEQTQKKTENVPSAQPLFKEKVNVNLSSVKPPRSSQIFKYENADHAAYEKTLNLQIDELFKLTNKFKASSKRGELWLRLAELYVEKASIIDNREQDEYDRNLKAFLANTIKTKPILNLEVAKSYNKKAIQLYDWFLRDFPNDPKVSQALFFLGYNNYELGNIQVGKKYYDELNARFPKSEYTGEAHFAIGEAHFENEKWVDAYKEYSFLIKDNKHSLHSMALYKAAWCLFRLGKTEQGIKYLNFIIKSARNAKQTSLASGKKINNARLENESMNDMVVFLADINDVKRSISYFRSLNNREPVQEANKYIEKLGYYLSNKGDREGSREVFKYLIASDPLGKKAFEYQFKIVENNFFTKNPLEFKSELYSWIKNYNSKSSWGQANQSDTQYIERCALQQEQTLRSYIMQQHQTAQNSRAPYSRQAADEGYRLYFLEFAKSVHAGNMHFFYGELLFDLGRFNEAAAEYTAVINGFPNNQYLEKSAQNVLLALEQILPTDDELQKQTGNSLEPITLDSKTSQFISSADWYLKKFPAASRAPEIRFRMGRLNYLTNNFDAAEKRFKEVVELHPKTKFSEYSANLLLDIYTLKKDYVGLEKIGSELLANQSISDSKMGAEIKVVLEKASFKLGQNLELEKKYLESAKQFQTFALKHEKSDLNMAALYNAAINFERSGKNKEAVVNYKKVISHKSAGTNLNDKSLKPKAKRLLAKLSQESGLFEETAKLYSELANENPTDPLNDSYLYNSGVMLEIIGNRSEAIKKYDKYMKTSKNKDDRAAVLFKIARMQRESNRLKDATTSYKTYLGMGDATSDKKIEAHYWIYDLSVKLGAPVYVASVETKINKLLLELTGRKKENAATFLAKINLIQAKETFNRLKSIKIPANASKQKAAVGQKLEIMNQLNKQLGNIIKLNSSEEIIAALYTLGQSNEHLAQSFASVPVPAGLNPDQKKLYLSEIEKITEPLVKKSDEGYKSAIEKGAELRMYSEAYNNSFNKMNKKYPQQFYYMGEQSSEIKSIDWAMDND